MAEATGADRLAAEWFDRSLENLLKDAALARIAGQAGRWEDARHWLVVAGSHLFSGLELASWAEQLEVDVDESEMAP